MSLFIPSLATYRASFNSRTGRRVSTGAVLLAVVMSFSACGHKDHWQAFTDDTGHYQASFPGDVSADAQNIDINGSTLPMRVHTGTARDGATFAIGSVALPNDQPALRQAVLDELASDLARNAGRPAPAVPVQMHDVQGNVLNGQEWRSEGTIPGTGQHRVVMARFVAKGQIAYEAVIVAENAPSTQIIDRFFSDFKPR